jgi:hypothetical protein
MRKLLGVGGIVGSVALVTAILIVSAGRPGYSHATDAISRLGEIGGHWAPLMNFGGFLIYGLAVVGLAYGLYLAFRGRSGDWLGPALLGAYGVCYMAIALAPCDPGCTGTSAATHEKAHVLLSRVIIMLAFATPLVLFPQFSRVAPWSRVSGLSVLLLVMGYLVFLGAVPGVEFGWQQCVWLGSMVAWVAVSGAYLARSSSQ